MTRTSTTLLGAGLLMAGLAMPLAASAGSKDEGLAFVAGAVVGHVLSEHPHRVHYVHRHPHPVHVPAVHYRHHPKWHKRHHGWDKKHYAWDGKHRHHGYRDRDHRHHRYDRRHDGRDRDWGRRGQRRG